MFGVCGFLAVSDIVFVSFKSASKPSAGLSCELMVACVTFQLLYMLLWNCSFWLLWTVRFYIVMMSSMYTTLRQRFLNIFFIMYSYMVLEAGELCPFVIMFVCTSVLFLCCCLLHYFW